MKVYDEQRYPHTQRFKITYTIFGKTESFIDEHKGLNKGHATYLAEQNWLGMKVEAID